MHISSWLKFTLLAALGPQALAKIIADQGADKGTLGASGRPHSFRDPLPGDDDNHGAGSPPPGVVVPRPHDTTTAPHPGTIHNKRTSEALRRFPELRENNLDEHGRELKWGEGKRLPPNLWPNSFLPQMGYRPEENKGGENKEQAHSPSPRRGGQQSSFPKSPRSVEGRIAARSNDPDAGKQGVDADGNPISKLGRVHRIQRGRRVSPRGEEPSVLEARARPVLTTEPKSKSPKAKKPKEPKEPKDETTPEEQQGDPRPRENNVYNPDGSFNKYAARGLEARARPVLTTEPKPKSPKAKKPKEPKEPKDETTPEEQQGDPRPRENNVYNPDGSFNKYAARGLEARTEPKYYDANADPSSRDKGVHMDDGSIAPHGRRVRNGKSCRA
ncbi:hypothetical protein MCOR30_010182 [Pyricularia oryzae]|nr:hypothetical protein MCOR30_010182 [Pyricularia oryzae]KAI6409221.1 hypothetical protein MCOR24_007260 [Pyricularia oryzae]